MFLTGRSPTFKFSSDVSMSGWMRVFPKRGDPLYPGDADMAEYLSYLRDGYDQDPAGAGLDGTITSLINLIFRIRDET